MLHLQKANAFAFKARKQSLPWACGRLRASSRPAGVQHTSSTQSSEKSCLEPLINPWAGVAAITPILLAVAPALAEVDDDVITEAAEANQAVMDSLAKEQSGLDLVASVLFGGVVLTLSVMTLGVAYLSLKQWLDERQEAADKEALKKPKPVGAAANKSEAKESDDDMLPLKRSFQTKRDKTKGFGANVVTKPKEF